MFCPNCGTQVSDNAAFCRKCGTSLREDVEPAPQPAVEQPVPPQPAAEQPVPPQPVYQQPAPPQPVMPQQRPVAAQTIPRPPARATPAAGVQPAIGVVVMIGAALAAIGSFLPWLDFAGQTANGFDVGYLTDSSGGGNDGIVILLLGLGAAGLAAHYFMKPNSLLSLGSLILGAAAAGVAAYDFVRLYKDINDGCGGCSPIVDYLSYGLYVTIAGGAIAAGASFIGFRREGSA